MEFKLPFDGGAVDGMAGRTMVLSENHRNESLFRPVKELEVGAGGDCQKPWRFEADGGSLRLLREGQLFCGFRGLESRGGRPYAVGHRAEAEARQGFSRMTMHERVLLGKVGCGVCISSHVDYKDDTLEPVLKSLRKTGFDMSRARVVVDGDKRWANWQEDRADGVRVVRANADAMGFAGLLEAGQDFPYWLLVHDTCEFERGFAEKLASVDVGLEPDMVLLFDPSEGKELGLYSSGFLGSCGVSVPSTKPQDLFKAFLGRAGVVSVLPGKTRAEPEKDVYGNGTRRRTVKVESIGLRKFEGKLPRGGRP